MTIHIRKCPGCRDERSVEEVLCGGCGWDLTQEPLRLPGQVDRIPESAAPSISIRHCLNGHPLDPDDEMCFSCGATAAIEGVPAEQSPTSTETIIDGWTAIDRLETPSEAFESFIVERHGHRVLLTFYLTDAPQDSTIYEVLKRLPKDYVPELLAYGEWEGRRYEVTDFIPQSNLSDLISTPIELETIRQIVKSVGRILCSLTDNGLRHGNIRPENILISQIDPLHLMLTGFQYSRLSTFDLDIVTRPMSAHYTAPEVIAGGISVASDWWSLGMIILQLLTKGACFDGINEKAFRIHVVTRGVSLPKGIDPILNLLLRGLLARDPDQRWQWSQIQGWLAGESVEAPSDAKHEESRGGPALEFKDHSYTCPKAYALIGVEAAHWDQAKDLLMRGVIATWLEDRKVDPKIIAGVRLVASIDSIPDDFRHALALMYMNPSLPLIYQGEIVTSSWLLQNPIQGYEILTGPLVAHLRQMNRELHLCELHDRIARAQEKAQILEIELSEESFKLLALASSRPNLERQWAIHRRLYPGSDHSGLNSLLDRQKTSDEELMILLGASLHQYQPSEQILTQAKALADQAGISSYEGTDAHKWFDISRRDLYREIEERTANYSRCGIPRIDEWANDFRNERRISLSRTLVLLSIPKESWQEPPRQQYVSAILEFFEKRTASLAQRGPLVRMLIGKSSSRVNLAGIAGKKPTASSILEHLISRVEAPVGIDRAAFEEDPELERRLRRLVSHARTYKRDTGIDSLYLGFPFLVMRDNTEAKPRIAPILLWPIKIDMENRDRISILFDRDREEVRVNPTLTGLIGPDEAKRWSETAKELLGRAAICTGDVIDAFGSLADPRERTLCDLPGSDYKIKAGLRQIVCSAVLFHAEFMGQAIGEDLRQMKKESPVATGLETALRVNKDPITSPPLPSIPEKDRYFTMESDPSQEKAVFRARQSPGLLIEGPPGTGKSQTIVNIIGDCIGRNQTVLVVCQKSAALEVLAKRLDAEGLRERYFYITHVNKDRVSVIQSIRTQIEGITQSIRAYRSENVERERDELAEKIEKLEKEIDKHHGAIHSIDDATGLSYRILLGQLIDLEDHETRLIDAPALRRLLLDLDQKRLTSIEETCSPIAGIWLASAFEGNPLVNLKLFSSDTALSNEFISSLFAFIDREKRRDEVNQKSITTFDVDDPSPHQEWVKAHDKLLKKVDWQNIALWFHLFAPSDQSKGSEVTKQLEELKLVLSYLDLKDHDPQLSVKVIERPLSTVGKWLSLAKSATAPRSFFSGLNPFRLIKHRRIQKILSELGEEPTLERIGQLQKATHLEIQQRPMRQEALRLLGLLYPETQLAMPLVLKELRLTIDRTIGDLALARNGILALHACPRQEEVESIVKTGLPAYQDLISRYGEAFARHQARSNSLDVLDRLSPFFCDDLFNSSRINIQENRSNISDLQPIVEALPSLSAYQEFRLQAPDLSSEILKIFAVLREKEKELKEYPIEELEGIIRRLIAREARLAWKDRIEQKFPILKIAQKELSRKIQVLDESNTKMRKLNQKFLAFNMDIEKVRVPEDWEDITRLRGPRARRLREVIERGWDMGLMQLRPVWLMNPDTASQLLPLRPGMFDVIIFDEASQIPIENALPTLYRAKRAVISGDEKQMPPTHVFMKRMGDDEEYSSDEDDLDEMISEAERDALEDTWNRREIKDCSDLLALGKTVLPKSMLQIHYRSKYRELIAFSNAAFYGNHLSVPVRHPESVIQTIRPIEVIRVDGIYANQTNRKEAERVVELLADKWLSSERPSIGIVTFNAKQADLIEDALAERADNDPAFRQALAQEKERQQGGEDMSFFVKNVENVQGDERDMIIFSSTFGRDEEGAFRRQFGLLSQTGGERRLNVAITRAREKIILVTSLPINEISDGLSNRQGPKNSRDYLQAYFEYASKVSDGSLEAAHRSLDIMASENPSSQMSSNFDKDGFIRSVSAFIRSLGLKPAAIKENDAFGLDFVIEDPEKKRFGIGIECDAHCHPILETARAREVWRPKVLRMEIPHVHRVTSYAWYHRRKEEMDRLKQVLEEALGIMLTGTSINVGVGG